MEDCNTDKLKGVSARIKAAADRSRKHLDFLKDDCV